MMAVAETLKSLGSLTRQLYLYDTYDGMSEPTEHDKTFSGEDCGSRLLKSNSDTEQNLVWAYSALDTVITKYAIDGLPCR